MTTQAVSKRLADDLLNGAKEIAEYLGWARPRVNYMVRAGHIPVIYIGRRMYARKSELERMFVGATPARDIGPAGKADAA